jgi:hypothetical protein
MHARRMMIRGRERSISIRRAMNISTVLILEGSMVRHTVLPIPSRLTRFAIPLLEVGLWESHERKADLAQ